MSSCGRRYHNRCGNPDVRENSGRRSTKRVPPLDAWSDLDRTTEELVRQLTELSAFGFELVEPHRRNVASSWHTWRAATLFIVVVRYIDAVAHYAAAFSSERQIPTEPLATLVRGLMEASDALHYAYFDRMASEERELRRLVGALHHAREEREFRQLITVGEGDWMSNFGGLGGFIAEREIGDNAAFKRLSEAQQCELRSARRHRSGILPRHTLPFGWSKEELEAAYKFLSNFAHSTMWSEYGAAIRATDKLGTQSALLFATHIAAWTIERYCRRRAKLAKRLSDAQRARLRAFSRHQTMKELRILWKPTQERWSSKEG